LGAWFCRLAFAAPDASIAAVFMLPRGLSLSRRLWLLLPALLLLATFCHAHIPHGNGVINTGSRGRYSADNLDGAMAFQATDAYAQTQSYKDMLRRDYVRGIVDSVIAQEGGQKQALTAAEKQALVRLLQGEDHDKPLSSYKIAAIARGALNTAAAANTLDASAPRLHTLLTGWSQPGGGIAGAPQSPAQVLNALADNDPYHGVTPAHHRHSWEDTDGDGVSNQDEWDLNTDADDIFHTPTAEELAELERQRIEAAKTFAQRQAERQAAEQERKRLEAEAWQQTLETEHQAQRDYEAEHPELVRQTADRMLTENFTPIVKVDENGRPLMLVRRAGPDGQEVDVWATPKDQELADNFVQNSAGEWELRGEQERQRTFTDERFGSDYLAPAMQKANDSTMAFVEVNLTMAGIVAGGAGVSGAVPKIVAMGKEAVSEFTGIPVGLKDIKDGVKALFAKKALKQADDIADAAAKTPLTPNPYAGVQEASAYLKAQGVPRDARVQILQSFDVRTIQVRQAGGSEFGLRYFDGVNAQAKGRYLFETFPASRASLALDPKWNGMTNFTQWQVRPGATLLEGGASPQGVGLPGGQIQKFVPNLNDLLSP